MEKIQALSEWRRNPIFNDEERLMLEYVEAVTDSKGEIDAHIKAQMSGAYTEKDLVEITALIAFQNMSTKFNNAFGIEPQGFCFLKMQVK